MSNDAKPSGRVILDPQFSSELVRRVDHGDPPIDDAGRVLGDLKVPFQPHGDPSPDGGDTVVLGTLKVPFRNLGDPAPEGGFEVVSTQLHLPDLHRGEDDEDDKKKRAEEKARQAELLGDSRGEQADHFKEAEPPKDPPPKPNERIGMATRTRG